MNPNVVLVDDEDKVIGIEEKMKAHELGLLHRAFSILIFNSNGEMLIHKRASSKYHCPGLWTNACCSHQDDERSLDECAQERLYEEMGLRCERLRVMFKFRYKKKFNNGLTENEIDTVLFGIADEKPKPDPKEVEDHMYVKVDDLLKDVKKFPDRYTVWFMKILEHQDFERFMANYGRYSSF